MLAVRDTGIGMTEEQLGRLFEAFAQAEAATAAKYGGTGLGLAISKKFCEMMGGRVAVESAPGVGTTFTVRLPVKPPAPVAEAATVEGAADAPTVLVIDDDPAARDLLQKILVREGFRVVTVSDGAMALAAARAERPAAITLDVMMPGMDGWAVLTALKSDPALSDIPVVMVTVLEDRQLGFALGAADHLTKPVERARLVEALKRQRGSAEAEASLREQGWRIAVSDAGPAELGAEMRALIAERRVGSAS